MTTRDNSNPTTAALGNAAGLATIWVVAAILRPTATFHLAPILIALAPVLTTSNGSSGRARLAASAALIALGTSLALAMADLMRGPSLLPFGGALAEAVVFTAAAGATMLGISCLGSRRRA